MDVLHNARFYHRFSDVPLRSRCSVTRMRSDRKWDQANTAVGEIKNFHLSDEPELFLNQCFVPWVGGDSPGKFALRTTTRFGREESRPQDSRACYRIG
jgi:hypothetical protein